MFCSGGLTNSVKKEKFKYFVFLLIGLFICFTSSIIKASPLVLPISVFEKMPNLHLFDAGRCPNVAEVDLQNNQSLLELIIICSAFKEAGVEIVFDFKPTRDYLRIINNVHTAVVIMPGFTVWENDIDRNLLYVTEPIIDRKEFVKGLYTRVNNSKTLGITNKEQLKNFVVAANPNWTHDNQEIACSGLKTNKGLFGPIVMARMVYAERADFLLFPFFASDDLSGFLDGSLLTPLVGMKIVFSESLHFVVSKEHPQGELFYTLLEKGIFLLKKKGYIREVYSRLGFFNEKVSSWQDVGCIDKK